MLLHVTISNEDGEILGDFKVTDGPAGELIPKERASDRDLVRFATKIEDHVSGKFNVVED